MILFMIKKVFFDMWDNMYRIVILNLGFILAMGAVFFLPYLFQDSVALFFVALAVGIEVFFLYAGAAFRVTSDIADYKQPGFAEFFRYFTETWKTSLVFGLIVGVHLFVLSVALPFYAQVGGFLALAAMAFIFWISVFWLLASQYYFPIEARLDRNIKKVLKKCFLLFFDNTGFSIAMAIGVLAVTIISGFTAFLLPGLGSVALWLSVGFKLRMYKYDYLEEHPDTNRRKIPWDVLLMDDEERVGKRTLRGMIFPWKE
jgi:uncharacterized membrane protein YesL